MAGYKCGVTARLRHIESHLYPKDIFAGPLNEDDVSRP